MAPRQGSGDKSLTPRVVVASCWSSPFCVTMRDSSFLRNQGSSPLPFSSDLFWFPSSVPLPPSAEDDHRDLSIAPSPLLGDFSPTFSKAALSLTQNRFSLCSPCGLGCSPQSSSSHCSLLSPALSHKARAAIGLPNFFWSISASLDSSLPPFNCHNTGEIFT